MADAKNSSPLLALTMGEPAGIGPEITIKAWLARQSESLPAFFVTGDPDIYSAVARNCGLHVPVRVIGKASEAVDVFPHSLPVLPISLDDAVISGQLSPKNAQAVISSIDLACDLALRNEISGMVTNPIHKRALYEAGMKLPGHTEYLAQRTGGSIPVMMLSCPGLRVVPVTVHLSLREAVSALSTQKIVQQGASLAHALKNDFGIASPRIAVAALNPHAGEDGHMGREEIEIIGPAIDILSREVPFARIWGPSPSDTLFHVAARAGYDAVLCMYHDQALIPLKTIDFERGVNTTLGLPIIRTSPDHGTALDIAGKNLAHPGSLIEAIRMAGEMTKHRHIL